MKFPQEYTIRSRYGTDRKIVVTSKTTGYVDLGETHYVRRGHDDNGLVFIDPDGGPFIHTHDMLNHLHSKAPKLNIVSITQNTETGFYDLVLSPPSKIQKLEEKLHNKGWQYLKYIDGAFWGVHKTAGYLRVNDDGTDNRVLITV
jgi:hypothetical protein